MKSLIIANWKMNPITIGEAEKLFREVEKGLKDSKKAELVICPPFIYLPFFQNKKSLIKLGGQNCFFQDKGAFTGEISVLMLKNLKCQYILIGHSERRHFFSENNSLINKKIKGVLGKKLIPVLCLGESKADKEKGKIQAVLKKQLEAALKGIKKENIEKIILAYEPVWAIGTGKACSPDQAKIARIFLKKILSQKFSRSLAEKIIILYGGSVDSSNVQDFIKEAGFQGVLVGSASLNYQEFIKLVRLI